MKKTVALLTAFSFVLSTFSQNNSVLWKISSPNFAAPFYLLGTMHLAQKAAVNFPDSVYAAINSTEAFYGELNYGESAMASFAENEHFFTDKLAYLDSIKKTAAWKAMIEHTNVKYGTHINPDSLEQFSEFGSKHLQNTYQPEPGMEIMDIMLGKHAMSLGKKIGGLETYIFQIDMLYKIIGARLQDTSIGFDDDKIMLEGLQKFYYDQQLDSVADIIGKINPGYRKIIFTARNISMADSIQLICARQPTFFAIGTGHLVGDDGVIMLLRKKGFTVTPVFSNTRTSLLLINRAKQLSIKAIKKIVKADASRKNKEERIEEIKEEVKVIEPLKN